MVTPEQTTNAVDVSVTAAKVGSIAAHVRENNVAYLLGIGILHMLGITERVWTYGSGMC